MSNKKGPLSQTSSGPRRVISRAKPEALVEFDERNVKIVDVRTKRPINEPEKLIAVAATAERIMAGFKALNVGLADTFLECLMSGRMDQWKAAAHAVVDLIGDPRDAIIVKRKSLP